MEQLSEKLEVLRAIARECRTRGLTWAVGASALLYFKGIVEEFHDLDLFVTLEDAPALEQILRSLGSFCPSQADPRYCTVYFREYRIRGVDVDLMGGFRIREGEQIHDGSLQPDQIRDRVMLEGEAIPLMDLELWVRYYTWMGRPSRAEQIRAFLAAQPDK